MFQEILNLKNSKQKEKQESDLSKQSSEEQNPNKRVGSPENKNSKNQAFSKAISQGEDMEVDDSKEEHQEKRLDYLLQKKIDLGNSEVQRTLKTLYETKNFKKKKARLSQEENGEEQGNAVQNNRRKSVLSQSKNVQQDINMLYTRKRLSVQFNQAELQGILQNGSNLQVIKKNNNDVCKETKDSLTNKSFNKSQGTYEIKQETQKIYGVQLEEQEDYLKHYKEESDSESEQEKVKEKVKEKTEKENEKEKEKQKENNNQGENSQNDNRLDQVKQKLKPIQTEKFTGLLAKLKQVQKEEEKKDNIENEFINKLDNFYEAKNYELSTDKYKKGQQLLYLLVNEPDSFKLATFYCFFMLAIILGSIGCLILETEVDFDFQNLWIYYQKIAIFIFATDLALKFVAFNAFQETFKEFLLKGYTIIDIIAILYEFFELFYYLVYGDLNPFVKILRIFSILRSIRIFKLSTIGKGIPIMIEGLKQSSQALGMLLFITAVCVLIISTAVYFVEGVLFVDDHQKEVIINDIPTALWWAVTTITTVGYGDYVPETVVGKLIASVSLIFGVLLLSLPTAIIGNKFQQLYMDEQQKGLSKQRNQTKTLYIKSKSREEKEIYHIMLRLNELEEVNQNIENQLKDTQFLYRSLMRDAQNLIDKIDIAQQEETLADKNKKKREEKFREYIASINERIQNKRNQKLKQENNQKN